MTNPDNAVGTNGAFGGRTSVNAFNDDLQMFAGRGWLSGWAIKPDSGLNVAVGGDAGVRDVAIAEDANGNRTTVNNISAAPIIVEIAAPPSSGQRIDSIVVYVDNPPQGEDTATDNPAPCGIIAVQGTNNAAPSGTQIREAITADGASGSTAYYCTIGRVTIPSGTTDIDNSMISQGNFGVLFRNTALVKDVPDSVFTLDVGTLQHNNSAIIGKYMVLSLKLTGVTVPANSTNTIARLASGYRPVKEAVVIAQVVKTDGGTSYGWANTAGEVRCRLGTTALSSAELRILGWLKIA